MSNHSLFAEETSFDVIVYGGVPCGIVAAIAAARNGAKVLLVEPTRHIGGLSTSGINTAESEHMLKWTIGGLAREFYERLGKYYGTNQAEFYFESSVAERVYQEMLQEAGVTIRFGRRVEKVEKRGAQIERILLDDGSWLSAKVFIDAGYEGDLMARTGVSYTFGREARDEYNEEAAGIRFDKQARRAATVDEDGNLLPGISAWAKDLKEGAAHPGPMNYSFRLCFAKDVDKKVPIPLPDNYDRKRYRLLENWLREKAARKEEVQLTHLLEFYKRRNGKYEGNNKQNAIISLGHFGGQFGWPDGSYAERERIFQDHKDYTLGLLHFLANDESVPHNVRVEMQSWGFHKEEFADNNHFPYQLYVREARRMKGQSIVTQNDIVGDAPQPRRKADSIGISSHFIDSHHVQRVALSPTEFINEGRIWRIGWAYQIRYSALTPKANECTNLLVPGAASFSHVAFCSYRLESVWMIAGHAAGVAAALSARAKVSVQNVNMQTLQDTLRAQKQVVDFIAGQPEKFQGGPGYPEF
ncbi:MAG TPA: FAD-dependent oxidoreductase [Abditibacteriaceae bacterium]|jgi:hypothetical protein